MKLLFLSLTFIHLALFSNSPPRIFYTGENFAFCIGPEGADIFEHIEEAKTFYENQNSSTLPSLNESKKIIISVFKIADRPRLKTLCELDTNNITKTKRKFFENDEINWALFPICPYIHPIEKDGLNPQSIAAQKDLIFNNFGLFSFLETLSLKIRNSNKFCYCYIHCIHGISRSYAFSSALLLKEFNLSQDETNKILQSADRPASYHHTHHFLQTFESLLEKSYEIRKLENLYLENTKHSFDVDDHKVIDLLFDDHFQNLEQEK